MISWPDHGGELSRRRKHQLACQRIWCHQPPLPSVRRRRRSYTTCARSSATAPRRRRFGGRAGPGCRRGGAGAGRRVGRHRGGDGGDRGPFTSPTPTIRAKQLLSPPDRRPEISDR